MSETNLTDVWIEGQVDENSISLTLLSESQNGAKVEEIKSFTLDELTDLSGEIFSMNLSDETREAIQSTTENDIMAEDEFAAEFVAPDTERDTSNTGDYTLPSTGDIVHDTEGPDWGESTRMEVTDVLWNTRAKEFNINDDSIYEKTVYSVNNCEPDEPVIMARYVEGSGDEYAFPVTRLEF
jgi:hypothetical protein